MSGVFKEKQVYPFWVVISIGLILAMMPVALIDYVDQSPGEDLNGALFSSAIILFVALLFAFIKLKVRIDDREIRYKFFPFFWREKTIKWSEMKTVEVRKSKSIREFGGWGYRIGKGKRAYTLYGRWGIDITLGNNKHHFIGTQKHCELDAFLKDYIYPKYPGIKPDNKSVSGCD